MRRLWFGVALLAALLILGIVCALYAGHTQQEISQTLSQAREAAEVGKWEEAAGLSFQAQELWNRHQHLTAVISDHGPMEEVESLFAQLESFLKLRDNGGFSVCCASLEVFTRAIAEAQKLNWWTLL